MIDLVQTIIRPIWEGLLIIPMPWRATIVFLLFIPISSWLFWRGVPWLLPKISQLLLVCGELLVKLVLLPEYLITQKIKKRRRQVPLWIYKFDDLLSEILSFIHETKQALEKLRDYAFNKNKNWLPRTKWYVITAITLLFLWFARPSLGENTAAKLIDSGKISWYSLEGWVLTGKWQHSPLSFPPEQFVWDYCAAINKRQFQQAWNMTTVQFQSNQKFEGTDSYLEWWRDKVEEVKLNKVSLVSRNNSYATVDLNWQFLMRKTQKWSNPESGSFCMIWDSQSGRWLLNRTKCTL